MTLWILISFITIIGIGYVCMPLFRAKQQHPNEMQIEKTLYEARIAELDNEFALARIDNASLNAAKAEEARKLLKLSNQLSSPNKLLSSNRAWLLFTIFFIPLFSFGTYLSLGSPQVTYKQEAIEFNEQANLEELLEIAELRLQQQPDDLRGWVTIAPVYARRGEFTKAINAYKNAIRLSAKDPDLTFTLGEVYVNQAQGNINKEALALFEKTIELQPNHPSARFMLGMAAYQNGNHNEAIRRWENLIKSAQGGEDWINVVQQRIDAVRAESDNRPIVDQEAINDVASLSPEERFERINQMVEGLAKRLQDDPSDKQSWARLIRSYIVLGKFEEAEQAIQKVSDLFVDDANLQPFLLDVKTQLENAKAGNNQ